MINGLEYVFKKDKRIFYDFFVNPIDFNKDKRGNEITKNSELYSKSQEIQNSIKNFEDGQNSISKIKSKYSGVGLELYFKNKGEDFTEGFISNFEYNPSPFCLPTGVNGNAGDLIEEIGEVVNEVSEIFLNNVNKIFYKKEYNSALNVLKLMEYKK